MIKLQVRLNYLCFVAPPVLRRGLDIYYDLGNNSGFIPEGGELRQMGEALGLDQALGGAKALIHPKLESNSMDSATVGSLNYLNYLMYIGELESHLWGSVLPTSETFSTVTNSQSNDLNERSYLLHSLTLIRIIQNQPVTGHGS